MEGSCRKVLCNGLMWEPPPLTLAGLVGPPSSQTHFWVSDVPEGPAFHLPTSLGQTLETRMGRASDDAVV